MAVTGLANLAVKVADLDAAVDFYERAGAEVRDRMEWNGGERADVHLGPVMITLFTRAIGLFHWVTATDGGIRVTDVWESQAQLDAIAQEQIGPISAEVGLPNPPTITTYEVHNYLTAGDSPQG
jgi:hypothetical protein